MYKHYKYIKNKNILICPLNWGLGHATRDIQIIENLINNKNKIYFAGNGSSLHYLQKYFKEIKNFKLHNTKVFYFFKKNMFLNIFLQLPKFLVSFFVDKYKLKQIIKHNDIDIIISDNRFACFNRNIYSIYITHQVNIKIPGYNIFIDKILCFLHRKLIEKYDELWIPDFEGENNLSGTLSHEIKFKENYFYINPLSRFYAKKKIKSLPKKYDYLALISGPEPARSRFEDLIIKLASKTVKKIVIVKGIIEKEQKIIQFSDNIKIYNYINDNELLNLLACTEILIMRSGYSSIMDFHYLKFKNIILVPTEQQPEQEYLAKICSNRFKQYTYTEQEKLFELIN